MSSVQGLQKEVHNIHRRFDHVFGTFRERLREIIIAQPILEENLHEVDCNDLANDKVVKALYVSEYGPIKDHKEYLASMELIIRSLVRELTSKGNEGINDQNSMQAD